MIKNIVFDIGNVLVDFGWKPFFQKFNITDEELEHLEMMVNAVLMENIIDVFEVKKASGEELVFDEEESYNVKCLVEGLSWFGFYSDIFDVESPFEVEI